MTPVPRTPGLLALALLLVGAGCDPGAAVAPHVDEPTVVEVARVEPEVLRDVATLGGQLTAEHSVLLKPESHGVVAEVRFEEGARVAGGDVLVRLRSAEQAARLREAQAQRALAREVFERTQELVKRDAASLAKHDEAAAQLAVADARVELARVALERTQIRAPFDGVAGARRVSPGDRVTDEDALVRIDAIDRLEAVFSMTERGIVVARSGLEVDVRVLPYPGESFPGVVHFVSPTLDPKTRRLTLKAWVPNPDGRLRAGLYAQVDLEVRRLEGALLVPEAAVVTDRQGTSVWRVRSDGTAERVPIQTGLRKHGRVEVTLGLRPGDVVVSAGTHKVQAGARIAAAPKPEASHARRPPGAAPDRGT